MFSFFLQLEVLLEIGKTCGVTHTHTRTSAHACTHTHEHAHTYY